MSSLLQIKQKLSFMVKLIVINIFLKYAFVVLLKVRISLDCYAELK